MLHLLAYFFGGAFFINAIPHLVNGVSGQPFPSPFASPPGKGKSSAMVNVLWGAANIMAAYLLVFQIGIFNPALFSHALAFGSGGLIMATILAWHFGGLPDSRE